MLLKNKRILITAGPTWVPIDSVRVISNTASGETGILLAEDFARMKAKVTLMLGPVGACCISKKIKVVNFKFFDELKAKLTREIKSGKYDTIIHSAAVSDYRPQKFYGDKVRSGLKRWRLSLVPTEKLISRIKRINPSLFLVGFKFEPAAGKEKLVKEAKALLIQEKADLIVANTVNKGHYKAYIVSKNKLLTQALSKNELNKKLVKIISEA